MTADRLPHHTISRAVSQTLETYEREAARFLARWGRKRYKLPPLLVEWLTYLPEGARVLDLGCGGGQDARYLARKGYRVFGLDATGPLLRFAKRRRAGVPLVLADMRALPIRARSLDGVWAAASLMHLPKRELVDVLPMLRRCLRSGGILAATVTHGTRSRVATRGWIPGRYFARWEKAELTRVLRRSGWQIVLVQVVRNQERKGRWINVIARRG